MKASACQVAVSSSLPGPLRVMAPMKPPAAVPVTVPLAVSVDHSALNRSGSSSPRPRTISTDKNAPVSALRLGAICT